jgi:hypothetical protein
MILKQGFIYRLQLVKIDMLHASTLETPLHGPTLADSEHTACPFPVGLMTIAPTLNVMCSIQKTSQHRQI